MPSDEGHGMMENVLYTGRDKASHYSEGLFTHQHCRAANLRLLFYLAHYVSVEVRDMP